jgi:hypothetical protein
MRASPRSTTSCAPFSISRTTRRCRRHVPQSLSRALDVVLADPNSAARIDAARIGGFGASRRCTSARLLAAASARPGRSAFRRVLQRIARSLLHDRICGRSVDPRRRRRDPGWARTGCTFNVYPPESTVGAAACRFFGKPGVGPNTHFFTLLANECQDVKNNPLWIFEGLVFRTEGPDAIGACAANRVPAIRMHNNGKGGRANHRYLTSHSEVGVMLDRGWIVEGPVFCTPP